MKLGDRVLIKPLHKIVRDMDGSIIHENGKDVIVTPYHIRLARDKDIEICEAKIGKKTKSEKQGNPVTDKKTKGEPAQKKEKIVSEANAPGEHKGEKE